MSKLELQAIFERKSPNFDTSNCVVEQIVRLPGREFDFFRNNMLRDYDFIRDNIDSMFVTTDKRHCLLVLGEDRKDGVLVDSSGAAYARYAAFVPNAADILALDRSPALASLNEKLTAAVDYIAAQLVDGQSDIALSELEERFGISLARDSTLRGTVLEMLGERHELDALELDAQGLALRVIPTLTDAQRDWNYWTAVTESSRFKWTEDEIIRLNGHGAMYYIGGEDGQFIQIGKDGLLTAGTYEGAIPHIGDAMFSTVVTKQYPDYNAAFTAALEAGGKKFLIDMFSGNTIPRPHTEKPSVVGRIQEARLTPTKPKEQSAPKKDTRGTER